uniref:Facilitated trehalose transporter Tret1 n=1 Tax=Zeugodacus cucurbitae TaxID=28588 RepID=A0A0A1XB58_ZEUCU
MEYGDTYPYNQQTDHVVTMAVPSENAAQNCTPAVVHVKASVPPTGYAHSLQQPPQSVPPVEGWFARNRAIMPQMTSAGAAMLVLVSGGMNIAWSCGVTGVRSFRLERHIFICWYIAAIIGALVSAFITNRVSKRLIYLFSSFLVLIGGIFFVALAHEYGAIAVGRYLNGFAVGLMFVPMIVLIGEEVISSRRGMAAAILEAGSVTLGIYLQIVFTAAYAHKTTSFDNSFGPTQLHGIVVIVNAVLAFVMSYFLVVESPVQHLMENNELEAINCLRRLQRPFVVTQETYQRLEEHKRYIQANDPNGDKGIPALVKLCLIRGLVALSFSSVITSAVRFATLRYTIKTVTWPSYTIKIDTWPWILFGLFLWLGTYIAAFALDLVGRKIVPLISALLCGILAIAIGAICKDLINNFSQSKVGSVLFMLFVLGLFASFFSSSSSAYLTEAFPLHMKPFYIALSFTVQMFVLLIIGVCKKDQNTFGAYFITFGVFYLVFFIIGFFCLPETKQDSLQEAQRKFRNFLIR